MPAPGWTIESIDKAHQRVHDGKSFVISHSWTDNSLDIATPKYYRLTVPTGKRAHVEVEGWLIAAGLVELYEGPTLTGQGTPLTAINRNRASSNTANMVVAHSATISAAGTLLGHARINAAGAPGIAVGGQMDQRHEFILDAGDYLIKVSTDADNNKSWLNINWYEED